MSQYSFHDKELQETYYRIRQEFEADIEQLNKICEDIKTLEAYLSRFGTTSSLPIPIGQGNMIRWDIRKKRIVYFHKDKIAATRNLIETPGSVRILAAVQLPLLLKSMIEAKKVDDYVGFDEIRFKELNK